MQKVMCEHCKQEVLVMLYFYDDKIIVHESSALRDERYYEAVVSGKSICPYCGGEVHKTFRRSITKNDIVDLAGGHG